MLCNVSFQILGVLAVFPPFSIVERMVLDYNFHFRVLFGEFVQTYEETKRDIRDMSLLLCNVYFQNPR